MRRILLVVMAVAGIVCSVNGQAEYIKRVEIDTLVDELRINDTAYMVAGVKMRFPIKITNSGTPGCRYAPSMSFVIESPDGAEWVASELREYDLWNWQPFPGWFTDLYFSDLFNDYFYETFSYDGQGGDTIGFAGVTFPSDSGIFEGLDHYVWQLDVTPSMESAGMTICIDYGGSRDDGFDEGWNALDDGSGQGCDYPEQVHAEWMGPYCFTILPSDFNCCGRYLEGRTGNVDCDPAGLRNLADISRLIDNAYISGRPLCCSKNGNIDGDWRGSVNLADITSLINHVYVTHNETENCD